MSKQWPPRAREVREAELQQRIVRARFDTHWTAKLGYYFTNPRLELEDGTILKFQAKGDSDRPVRLLLERES